MPMESGNKNFEVKNYIQVARKVVAQFRAENVELIIAMTHQQDVSENYLVLVSLKLRPYKNIQNTKVTLRLSVLTEN